MKKIVFLFLFGFAAFLIVACSSTPSKSVPFQPVDPIPAGKAVVYFYFGPSDSDILVGPKNPPKVDIKEKNAKIVVATRDKKFSNFYNSGDSNSTAESKAPGLALLRLGCSTAFIVDPGDTSFDISFTTNTSDDTVYGKNGITITKLNAGDVRYVQLNYNLELGGVDVNVPLKTDRIVERMQAGWFRAPNPEPVSK